MHILANSHDYDDGNKQEQNETRQFKKKRKEQKENKEFNQQIEAPFVCWVCWFQCMQFKTGLEWKKEPTLDLRTMFQYSLHRVVSEHIQHAKYTTFQLPHGLENQTAPNSKQIQHFIFDIRTGTVYFIYFSSFSNDGLNQIESCAVLALIFHFFK